MSKNVRLTWKRQPNETGLRSVGQLERGWNLRADGVHVASVRPATRAFERATVGWWWSCPSDETRGIEWKNTASAPAKTPEEARDHCEDYVRKAMGLSARKPATAKAEPAVASRGGALAGHLQRFVRDAICSEEQKRALKKAGFTAYEHGGWNLTTAGRAEAIRLGYLED